jgi:subtilisin-like proprotein convertase family protein
VAGEAFATSALDIEVRESYLLSLDATFSTQGMAGLVFDQYSATDFKFAAISAATDEVIIGHYTGQSGWQVDATYSKTIDAGTDYNLGITLKGTTVSVELDGQAIMGYVFNALVVDGEAGVLTGADGASFDSITVQTNDPVYFDPNAVTESDPAAENNPVMTYAMDQPVAVPDRGQLVSTIEVTDTFTLQDINIKLDISHTRVSDLHVVLVSPSGTRIELFNGIGGSNDNFTDTVFDDDATTSIEDGSAPFTGVYRPVGDLSILEGENTAGTWTLEIYDQKGSQIGTLNFWQIIIETI